jgi:UPF0755 protein
MNIIFDNLTSMMQRLIQRLKSLSIFWKGIIVGCLILLLLAGSFARKYYLAVYKPNVLVSKILYIRTGGDFQQVLDSLVRNHILADLSTFKWVSSQKKYSKKVLSGAYQIQKGWNNNQLINVLRSGKQKSVKVTFNNIRFREDLAGRLSKYLEADSTAFFETLNDDRVAADLGMSCEEFPMLIIPNTYEFYWNTSPKEFIARMKIEYDRFWTNTRKDKAVKLALTPIQVVTIASIVQEESNMNSEKPRIAGVYINRFKSGWPLQADPTIKYALGDFQIKRVLTQYLTVDSPYNTYKNAGLPPGPINFPEIASVDAVLNAESHQYMYFCAKEDFSGSHNFAKTLSEHNQNAARYQNGLNKRKIFK